LPRCYPFTLRSVGYVVALFTRLRTLRLFDFTLYVVVTFDLLLLLLRLLLFDYVVTLLLFTLFPFGCLRCTLPVVTVVTLPLLLRSFDCLLRYALLIVVAIVDLRWLLFRCCCCRLRTLLLYVVTPV